MRRPMRLLAFLLMPLFLMGMGVRTGATIGDSFLGEEVSNGASGIVDQVCPEVQDGDLCLLGTDAAEVVEEEVRESGREHADDSDGACSSMIGGLCRGHAMWHGLLGSAGGLMEPSLDALIPPAGRIILFSVFRI